MLIFIEWNWGEGHDDGITSQTRVCFYMMYRARSQWEIYPVPSRFRHHEHGVNRVGSLSSTMWYNLYTFALMLLCPFLTLRSFRLLFLAKQLSRIGIITILLLVQHFPTDDMHSAQHCSYHSDCLCRLLGVWPTSRTKSSSGAQKVPFYWKPSFNAQNTRMGDVCEVGTKIQSVINRD